MSSEQDIKTTSTSKGLVPLEMDTWKAFTPKQQWDVIVSLRGPDTPNSETMKWFSTSVIRGKMRNVMRVGGTVNTDLNLILIPFGSILTAPEYPTEKETILNGAGKPIKWKKRIAPEEPSTPYQQYQSDLIEWYQDACFRWSENHFYQHVGEAAEILSIPIAHVEVKAYRKIIRAHYIEGARLALEALKDDPKYAREMSRHLDSLKKGYGY